MQDKRMFTTVNAGLVPFWHHINRNLAPTLADSRMIGWLGVGEKDSNYRIISNVASIGQRSGGSLHRGVEERFH